MKKIFLKIILSVVMRSSILVGGQAVINGVMMRVPGAYSTSVRMKDGTIKSKSIPFESINEKKGFNKIPILRGAVGLFEAMKIGYGTLNWSVLMAEPEESKQSNRFFDYLMNMVAILFAIGPAKTFAKTAP